jgi:tetratricopeptide (TPR) repeat protein
MQLARETRYLDVSAVHERLPSVADTEKLPEPRRGALLQLHALLHEQEGRYDAAMHVYTHQLQSPSLAEECADRLYDALTVRFNVFYVYALPSLSDSINVLEPHRGALLQLHEQEGRYDAAMHVYTHQLQSPSLAEECTDRLYDALTVGFNVFYVYALPSLSDSINVLEPHRGALLQLHVQEGRYDSAMRVYRHQLQSPSPFPRQGVRGSPLQCPHGVLLCCVILWCGSMLQAKRDSVPCISSGCREWPTPKGSLNPSTASCCASRRADMMR